MLRSKLFVEGSMNLIFKRKKRDYYTIRFMFMVQRNDNDQQNDQQAMIICHAVWPGKTTFFFQLLISIIHLIVYFSIWYKFIQ